MFGLGRFRYAVSTRPELQRGPNQSSTPVYRLQRVSSRLEVAGCWYGQEEFLIRPFLSPDMDLTKLVYPHLPAMESGVHSPRPRCARELEHYSCSDSGVPIDRLDNSSHESSKTLLCGFSRHPHLRSTLHLPPSSPWPIVVAYKVVVPHHEELNFFTLRSTILLDLVVHHSNHIATLSAMARSPYLGLRGMRLNTVLMIVAGIEFL